MKKRIIKLISPWFYPQIVFSKSIINELKANKQTGVIIDAPCGTGGISYHLSNIKDTTIYGYDISEECIRNAKSFFKAKNLIFEQCDIFQVFEKHKQADVFCLINSLFLLPEQDKVLNNIHELLNNDGLLILILPNIDGRNYLNFIKEGDNKKMNTLELSFAQFNSYFKDRGFKIEKTKGIVYTTGYNRKDAKIFSVFSHFYLAFLNFFETLFKFNPPNYYLLVLRKEISSN